MFLKANVKKYWGFKSKRQKKKKITIQSSAVQEAYGEAVWRRKRGGGRKSCQETVRFEGLFKTQKEVRSNMKPPIGQYISLKDIFDFGDPKER
jgi:hypothetical protein